MVDRRPVMSGTGPVHRKKGQRGIPTALERPLGALSHVEPPAFSPTAWSVSRNRTSGPLGRSLFGTIPEKVSHLVAPEASYAGPRLRVATRVPLRVGSPGSGRQLLALRALRVWSWVRNLVPMLPVTLRRGSGLSLTVGIGVERTERNVSGDSARSIRKHSGGVGLTRARRSATVPSAPRL